MPNYYNNELLMQYMQAEKEKEKKEGAREKDGSKKLHAAIEHANASAKVAFEQTQQNRFEIEELKSSLRKTKIVAVVAIIISIICMAMVMSEGLNSLIAMMP